LDPGAQALLERQVRAWVVEKRRIGIRNAAALLLDRRTMDVLASLGSADWSDAAISGQVDGTRAPRSPGSTLKPFAYALGFDQGLIHPMSMLKDAPSRYGTLNPENFAG